MLIDSNIVIMASKLQHAKLLSKLKENEAKIKVSIITKIEVLGYHQLKQVQKKFLENFFNAITALSTLNPNQLYFRWLHKC
jgi:toxin FitB